MFKTKRQDGKCTLPFIEIEEIARVFHKHIIHKTDEATDYHKHKQLHKDWESEKGNASQSAKHITKTKDTYFRRMLATLP